MLLTPRFCGVKDIGWRKWGLKKEQTSGVQQPDAKRRWAGNRPARVRAGMAGEVTCDSAGELVKDKTISCVTNQHKTRLSANGDISSFQKGGEVVLPGLLGPADIYKASEVYKASFSGWCAGSGTRSAQETNVFIVSMKLMSLLLCFHIVTICLLSTTRCQESHVLWIMRPSPPEFT